MDYPPDRHFRNYDEYSQGSAASHDDVVVYDNEYTFVQDSPTRLDGIDTRSMQSMAVDPVSWLNVLVKKLFLFTCDILLGTLRTIRYQESSEGTCTPSRTAGGLP